MFRRDKPSPWGSTALAKAGMGATAAAAPPTCVGETAARHAHTLLRHVLRAGGEGVEQRQEVAPRAEAPHHLRGGHEPSRLVRFRPCPTVCDCTLWRNSSTQPCDMSTIPRGQGPSPHHHTHTQHTWCVSSRPSARPSVTQKWSPCSEMEASPSSLWRSSAYRFMCTPSRYLGARAGRAAC